MARPALGILTGRLVLGAAWFLLVATDETTSGCASSTRRYATDRDLWLVLCALLTLAHAALVLMAPYLVRRPNGGIDLWRRQVQCGVAVRAVTMSAWFVALRQRTTAALAVAAVVGAIDVLWRLLELGTFVWYRHNVGASSTLISLCGMGVGLGVVGYMSFVTVSALVECA